VIVRAVDGFAERRRVHPIREALLALKNGLTFTPAHLPGILGNHVIARSGDVFAAFAHLAPGSTTVRSGQAVRVGEVIDRVGHADNSTTPQLHFQLMDAADQAIARGLQCAFQAYEVLGGGEWVEARNGIPGKADRIRRNEPPANGDG